MKKRQTREERLAEFAKKDENFRRLYEKVRDLNGGRIPTAKEIGQRLEARVLQGRRRASS